MSSRAPVAGHVVRHAFEHPQRHVAADQAGRDDVELELVGELVDDQAIEQIGRLVDRHHDAIAARLGERADAFLRRAGNDVLLPELAGRREQDQRQLHRQVVFQLGADVLIRALGVARDALEMRLDLRVVIDLEVFGLVGVPVEVVVADLVLAEVRDVARLRVREARHAGQRQHEENGQGHGRQRLPLRVRIVTPWCILRSKTPQSDPPESKIRSADLRPILGTPAFAKATAWQAAALGSRE